jgi:murein DD-endopeptidase MepM/ murein hydrolase activator NlpD
MLAVGLYGAAVATGSAGESAPPEGAIVGTSQLGLLYSPPREAAAGEPSDELRWPLRGGVTGQFGEQRGGHEHAGIDVPMPVGTPIRAAGTGRVVMREVQDGYGNYTCVAHVKITTCYAHQSRFKTKLGERVRRGEVIGFVGDTGTSSTPHLHFEVRRGTQPWGAPANPMKHLPSA